MVRKSLAIVCCAVLLGGCHYKELCYDHDHIVNVKVAFDWTKADAIHPAGMTVLFYNKENVALDPVRYDLAGTTGGSVRLEPGTYQMAAYNYDTETILYRGMENGTTLEAYTRTSSIEEGTQIASRSAMPRAAAAEDEPVILEPDPLCGAAIDAAEAGRDTTRAIVMTPTMRCREVTVTIRNVPNLKYTSQLGGSLSGLAPSIWMLTGEPGEGRATQAFTGHVVGDDTIVMTFRIFGHCPDGSPTNPHILTVYAILDDGSKWYYTQDVTSQMHDEPDDDYEISIELDELPIPKPIVNGSGLQPTIDGWQSINIDVTM